MNIFSCKQVAQKISLTNDQRIGLTERLGVMMHLMMCSHCRRFQRQMSFLSSVITKFRDIVPQKNFQKDFQSADLRLSDAARQRIARAMQTTEP